MTSYRERRESGMYAPPKGDQPQPEPEPEQATVEGGLDLDAMTKAELLEYAKQIGVEPANNSMSKDELRAAVDSKLGAG